MSICATTYTMSDGVVVIALDTENIDLATCQMVVNTGAEYDSQLMNFSPQNALEISSSVAVLWAVAFGFNAVKNVLISKVPNEES